MRLGVFSMSANLPARRESCAFVLHLNHFLWLISQTQHLSFHDLHGALTKRGSNFTGLVAASRIDCL